MHVLQTVYSAAVDSNQRRDVTKTETEIRQLQTKYLKTKEEKQNNQHHLDHQNDAFADSVKAFKVKINHVLDKLEHALMIKKDRHFEMKSEELRGCLKTCESALNALKESLGSLDIAAKQEDKQQKFMTIKKVNTLIRRWLYSLSIYNFCLPMRRCYDFSITKHAHM